jgi:hypothetical protein
VTRKKLLIWQNQWSPAYPFLLKNLIEQLTKIGIDYDFFAFENDIRLNYFDKRVSSYYSSLPIVHNIDIENYFGVIGEYERKGETKDVFKAFLNAGKKVFGYDYSSSDVHGLIIENITSYLPLPISHWLTTNKAHQRFVIKNNDKSGAQFSKAVGNLYFESAVRESKEKKDHLVFCANVCPTKDLGKRSHVIELCKPETIKEIEDATGRKVKIRLHPAHYAVYNYFMMEQKYFRGSAGSFPLSKFNGKIEDFVRQGFDTRLQSIIPPIDVLDITATCHAAVSSAPSAIPRELVLNGRDYLCVEDHIISDFMRNENKFFKENSNPNYRFFPLIKERLIEVKNNVVWKNKICDMINNESKFCDVYKGCQKIYRGESKDVSLNIANTIANFC